MKMFQVDLFGCPEFVKAKNVEEAEVEVIQNIDVQPFSDDGSETEYCPNPSCLVQGCDGSCEEC